MKQKNKFINWLTAKHQLIIRNEEDLAEKSTIRFSYSRLIYLFFFILIMFIGLGLVLSHTILRKWVNPAYIEQENNNKLMQLYLTAKELEEKNAVQEKFIKIFQSIIQGKNEPTYTIEDFANKQLKQDKASKLNQDAPLEPINTDTDIVSINKKTKIAQDYIASIPYNTSNYSSEVFLFTPIEGVITTPFDAQMEHYGLDIVGQENEPIKCIADGMVILSTWTVETGWIIIIQHSKNLISVYKHNAKLFKKTGNFVKTGEVIAIMGNSGELSTGPHLHFELWYDGNPVNPENFITF